VKVLVVVPFRAGDCEWRARSHEVVVGHLRRVLPDADIVDSDVPGEPFSRGAALNAAVRLSDADVIVAHDADVIADPAAVHEAIRLAAEQPGLVQPFDVMVHTSRATTRKVWDGEPCSGGQRWTETRKVPLVGTVNVCSRHTWETAGGWLDAFRGWGCEDVAFAAQCSRLVAPMRRVSGDLVHLWHPKTGKYAAPTTIAANGAAMTALLDLDHDALADTARRHARMMRTRYVVLCAGSGERWDNHFGQPKHFAPLLGEPLLGRVVRQVRDRDASADIRIVVRDLDDDRYDLPGCQRVLADLRPELGNADKLVSSAAAWHKSGRTVVLLGDVFYTDAVMDRIVTHDSDDWTLFGRPTGSTISGKKWNENFALSFWSEHHDLIRESTARLVALHAEGKVGRLSHSTWFRAAVGVPDDEVGTWDVDPMRFGHFEVCDDWTEDMDSPEDWEKWCYAWATARPGSRP
jgi:hypothetical protein